MADVALPLHRPAPDYNEAVVKKFIIAAMFWAIVAFLLGVWIATELAWPELNLGLSFLNFGRLRPVHTSAAIFAFGGSRAVGHVVPCRAAHLPHPPVRRRGARQFRVLGLPVLHRHGRAVLRDGLQPEPGIRRTRVAYRPLADGRVGGLRDHLHRHADEARGAAHLRGELVLPRIHPDHRRAAHRQQPGGPDLGVLRQELLGRVGRAERDDPVVVRPQRGGLLPDRGLPRDDVLLHPEGGEPPGVLATDCRWCTSGR